MFHRPKGATRLAALALAAGLALAACGSSESDDAGSDGLTDVTIVLGWLPTAESGGFYAAQQLGYYKDAGLNVTIEPGGPQVSGTQLVASGRADFGITGSGANEIVQANDEGIPLIAVNAILQDSLTGMMVHQDTGITDLKDTDGMTWVNSAGVLGVEWVKKKYGIDFKSMQYTGSIANFVKDDNLVQQGIVANEPYVAHQQGVDVTFMQFSETGFNPYNVITYTTKDYLKKNRDVVEKFVEASNKGWVDYMGDLDVATQVNDHLTTEVDKKLSPELTWFEWAAQRPSIVAGDGASKIGAMTEERWQTVIDQMKELGVLKGDVSVDDVADLTITPDIASPTDLPDAPKGSYDEITY